MRAVFEKPKYITDRALPQCGGCGHGIVFRMVAECLEELGVIERTVCAIGIGCCGTSWQIDGFDTINCPHGRAPAVATGVKRCDPNKIVYTYQGDGDCGAIGMGETQWAAARGENITVIMINNGIYGMTGGQMAPTTLEGQITTTSPYGRDIVATGAPLHLPEELAVFPGVKFVARTALYDTAQIRNTKKMLKKAFQNQIDGVGYSFVEILSTCPSNWHMSPCDAMDYVKSATMKEYPLGIIKDC